MEIDRNLQIKLVSLSFIKRLLYFRRYRYRYPVLVCFLTYSITYLLKVYFSCKNQLFATLKSDQDPGLDPHWFSSLDPDPHHLFIICLINNSKFYRVSTDLF
jgi:hypothetical protein